MASIANEVSFDENIIGDVRNTSICSEIFQKIVKLTDVTLIAGVDSVRYGYATQSQNSHIRNKDMH